MVDQDKFHWAKRVSRRDIQRLYESDAQGMLDEELLDDWLIHQFHVMQNEASMPVGENIIQGTIDQVRKLIAEILRLAPELSVKPEEQKG